MDLRTNQRSLLCLSPEELLDHVLEARARRRKHPDRPARLRPPSKKIDKLLQELTTEQIQQLLEMTSGGNK